MAVNVNIVLRPDEPLESALRRFKTAVNRSGVMAEIKRRELYVTGAQRTRRKRGKAIAFLRRKQHRRNARNDY